MKKYTLKCRDIGMDCDAVMEEKTVEELLQAAADHAAREHNFPQLPPNIQEKCRQLIKEVEEIE